MEEKRVILRCQKGEREAQRILYDRYFNYVYTISHRYVQHHHDTEDIVSIVFSRVFRNIHQLKNVANKGLKRWIQTITINESLRFLKRQKRMDYTCDHNILEYKEEIVEPTLEANMHLIKKLINAMPSGYRTIFLMNVVDGLSHTEIAEYLDISRNTSKSQMLKARKYLQNKLSEYASR